MKRRKEDKRPKVVNEAIKKAYARIAEKHYRRAISSISGLENEPGVESDKRLVIIERLLVKAGHDATRWYFAADRMD